MRSLTLPDHDRVDVSARRHFDVVRLRVEFVSDAGDASQAIIARLDLGAAERLHSDLARTLGLSMERRAMTDTEALVRSYLQKAHDRGGGWQMAMLMMAEEIVVLHSAVAALEIEVFAASDPTDPVGAALRSGSR